MSNIQLDFAIIGAPKAGSTSLYDFFSNLSDVLAISEAKDFPVFSRPHDISNRLKSLTDFGYSKVSQKPQIIADVNIVSDKTYLHALKEVAPDVRLIILIRRPQDRIVSSHAFNVERNLEDRPLHTSLNDEAYGLVPQQGTKDWLQKAYFLHSDYEEMIRNCLMVFKEEQLLVLNFDDIVRSCQLVLQQLSSFMKLDLNPDSQLPKSNSTSGHLRFRFLTKILFQGERTSFIWQLIRKYISQRNRSKIRFWLRRLMRTKVRIRAPATLDDDKLSEFARIELRRLERNYELLKSRYSSQE